MKTPNPYALLRYACGRSSPADKKAIERRLEADPSVRNQMEAIRRIRSDFGRYWDDFVGLDTPIQGLAVLGTLECFGLRVLASTRLLANAMWTGPLTLAPTFSGTGTPPPVSEPEGLPLPTGPTHHASPGPGPDVELLRAANLVVGKMVPEPEGRRLHVLVFVDRFPVRECQLTLIRDAERIASSQAEPVEGTGYALATFHALPDGAQLRFELLTDLPETWENPQ